MATLDNVTRNSIESVTITLTNKEAEVLVFICRSIGGCSNKSPRMVADEIGKVLENAGVKRKKFMCTESASHIMFLDGWKTTDEDY